MNPTCDYNKRLLMIGVLLLFCISTISAGIKPTQTSERLRNARGARVAYKRAEFAQQQNAQDREQMERDDAEKEEHGADHPDEAMRFRRLQLQDEKGVVPPDGLLKARQHVIQMRIAALGTIRPDSWSPLGPGNIGGRIRAITIDPTLPDFMLIGSASGGIWRTVNGGLSWGPMDDFMANLAVSTLVRNPTSPGIVYAGTGESFATDVNDPGQYFAPDGRRGAGVFRSSDDGVTWTQLQRTNPADPGICATPVNCPWFFVNRLAISANGNTILAATNNNIWRSTDDGQTWASGGIAGPVALLDIDFHPTDNVTGSERAIAGGNGEAFFSTDGGQNWTNANFDTPISGRVEIAYAPSDPLTVYASVNQATGVPPNQSNGDIYRSTNGGRDYFRRNGTVLPPNGSFTLLGGQGGYDNIIWVNPQDPNFLIVGGVLPFRSLDGGNTFDGIGDSSTNLPHADHHIIVAHPQFNNTTNRTVFFGNDGGIHRIADISIAPPVATGWVELNNNLGITQFYGAAGNATTGVIIGGTQDNGNVRLQGGDPESWTPITGMGGDGGFCAADPTDSNFFYGEYTYLQISRSTNGGASGSSIFNGIADAGDKGTNPQTANFIAPFILDPNDPNTMLAGGMSLWRSTNVKSATPTWVPIKAPTGNTVATNGISAIAVSPTTSTIIVVGHNNGDIFLTFNGTESSPVWGQKISPPSFNRFVTRLIIDHTRSPNWIYATFGGFSSDNVYRTTNLGATWSDITGAGVSGLPDVPVRSLAFHPSNPDLLYVGTEVGIFTSDNAGATWELPQNGPGNVSVDELFWMGGDLIAATHGRGLYRASGGTYVDCNWNGAELGTFNQPYRTVAAAVNAATTYRTIWIKPCTYIEPMTINKRLELRSLGGAAFIRGN